MIKHSILYDLYLLFTSCSLAFCDQVPGSFQTCPPGESCPDYPYCWVPCQSYEVGTWLTDSRVSGSLYYNGALCEQFPRNQQPGVSPIFLANVGPPNVPRYNFDSFYQSILTVFVILSQDGWSEMMFDAMRVGPGQATHAYCLYYLLVIFVGLYIVLNLFMGEMTLKTMAALCSFYLALTMSINHRCSQPF